MPQLNSVAPVDTQPHDGLSRIYTRFAWFFGVTIAISLIAQQSNLGVQFSYTPVWWNVMAIGTVVTVGTLMMFIAVTHAFKSWFRLTLRAMVIAQFCIPVGWLVFSDVQDIDGAPIMWFSSISALGLVCAPLVFSLRISLVMLFVGLPLNVLIGSLYVFHSETDFWESLFQVCVHLCHQSFFFLACYAVRKHLRRIENYTTREVQEKLETIESSARSSTRLRDAMLVHDTVLGVLSLHSRAGDSAHVRTAATQTIDRIRGVMEVRAEEHRPRVLSLLAPRKASAETSVEELIESIAERLEIDALVDYSTVHFIDKVPSEQMDEVITGAQADALQWAALEATRNAQHHSHSETPIVVTISAHEGVTITVEDDGRGFDDSQTEGRLGVRNSIYARMHDVGGIARIESGLGKGTIVSLRIPDAAEIEAKKPEIFHKAVVTAANIPPYVLGIIVLFMSVYSTFLVYFSDIWPSAWVLVAWGIVHTIVGYRAVKVGEFKENFFTVFSAVLVFGVAAIVWSQFVPNDERLTSIRIISFALSCYFVWMILRHQFIAAWAAVIVTAIVVFIRLEQIDAASVHMIAILVELVIVAVIGQFFALLMRPIRESLDALSISTVKLRLHRAEIEAVREERINFLGSVFVRSHEQLERIARGDDSPQSRILSVQLEGQIRDDIRAERLGTAQIQQAVWDARGRGINVTLVDDAQSHQDIDASEDHDIDDAVFAELTDKIVQTLNAARDGQVTVRLLPQGRLNVATILAVDSEGNTRLDTISARTDVASSQP